MEEEITNQALDAMELHNQMKIKRQTQSIVRFSYSLHFKWPKRWKRADLEAQERAKWKQK
ncbi:hypothetical protein H5410_016471 [Solanum commersonii]|uniref:Uncharacterized protein n=1 Tax=Solanum commersonii TaxID=4109 RepID=A0A9J5ZXR3_SOLCO|nr:hypothetical protein H5410_016471 [Solanum commersonii]